MPTLKGMLAHLRGFVQHRAADHELDEEIAFHLERETEKNIALGMNAAEARRRATANFGGVRRVKEEHRDVRGVTWWEELAGDTKFALRTLRRSPALAGAAVVTLALGIGANTAIFSAVNAVILRPLPFSAPDRLVMIGEDNPEKNWHMETAAPANVLDWREQVPAFQDVMSYASFTPRVTLVADGAPRLLKTAIVSGNFFDVLGVRPELGRAFRDQETWKTEPPVVILSHRAWADHFRSDPSIVGRSIKLDGRTVQVVGVMPSSFSFPQEDTELWITHAWDPASRGKVSFRRAHWIRPVARLKPGVSFTQANAQLQQVVERLKREYPQTNRVMGAEMVPLHEFLVGDTRLPLLVLLGAVSLLLLIACANIGNLLLVQAAGRTREVALRVALGAGRRRLVRQAFTESLVLSVIGGACGIALGWALTRLLVRLQPVGMLRVHDFGLDWSVLAYVIAITTLSGLLFGIAPALWGGHRAPVEALRDGGRGGDGHRMRRWGNLLVVGEVALSLVLTVGAGLLVRSFWQLRHVNAGFDPNGVLTVTINLPDFTYDTGPKATTFFDDLLRRVRALPGVSEAAFTGPLPLTGSGYTSDYTVFGRPPGEYGSEVAHRRISSGYFHAMRVPLLAGREFTAQDNAHGTPVVVINEALAKRAFPNESPIGKRISSDKQPDSTTIWSTIVGVVGNEHQETLALEPKVEMYLPYSQDETSGLVLVTRTTGDPASLAPSIRRTIEEMDPSLAIGDVRTMRVVFNDSLARERFLTTLLLVFAVVGIVLAVVGVYGVLAQQARRRTREMGIRIALGAQGSAVRWLIVRQGLSLTLAGLVVGGTVGVLGTRAMSKLLFQVAPADPLTFGVVAVVLTITSIVAAWLPASRASRADPASALRGE
jgi:putative ABC transport system permease protein